ncbi:AraC family transcriptional regulator [Paenibacillus sp. P2(2022)]|uniref:AraC family transcriptional regulator n=1 Tax=Paenibacillus TaxID=44249 RepID=UPI00211D9FF9|nr:MULTISPECIES: AraC family transcriptional regulator [Paenibacillus]MDG0052686.1 AraC family transcriptional regulator [Paenibacillus sp. P2(2022)]MDN4082295.1 AraC family transcriptional regulator [Paenibacillus polymyxa]MDN4107627.1 AraC family transcriptional regulator [Paenibacillus polymyxa]WOZ36751.1 AraC family transcriptional regulator [Paenibacillus polymyxa]
MDYFKRIQCAIEFIELNLREDLKIAEIASQAYFSAFHFQRVFQAISGFTVQQYIRRRRLSEAAKRLKQSNQKVLDIAIEYQYNSQEAFTRAFEKSFGITPGKYRNCDIELSDQSKINFLDYKKNATEELEVNKPVILQLETTKIVGYEYKTNLNNEQHYKEIPGFYEHFGAHEYFMCIPNKIAPGMSYGIACRFEDNGAFSFVVGEAVEEESKELAEGFIYMEIPAGKYAEFDASGSNGRVQSIRDFIYGTWLPNSNFERREGPDFEITDVMNSYPDHLSMKVYIPIE